MASRVVLRDAFDDVVVLDTFRSSPAERAAALPPGPASGRLRAYGWAVRDGRALSQLHELVFDHGVARRTAAPERDRVLRCVDEAVQLGRLLVLVRPRPQVALPVALEVEELGPEDEPTSWIEIELVDDTGQPVADEPYCIVTGDGRTRSGALDGRGFAREEGIDPGDCKVSFPRRREWRAA